MSRAAKQIFVGSRPFERNLEGSTIELRVAEKGVFFIYSGRVAEKERL